MKNRHLALTLASIITCLVIVFSSCKKINEATELGGDLIPTVDNINTFDTTLTVEAYNDLFTLGGTDPLKEDSLRSSFTETQFLGVINNDPFFGKTDAQMFFELKPDSYKYSFRNKPDSLNIDSVVLVLDYVETYGDTTIPQTINVYEIAQASDFRPDTAYIVRRNNNITLGGLLGSKIVIPSSLKDSVKAYQDTTIRQLRIRLNDAFGKRLLEYDTLGGANDAYSSDSSFKSKFKGFALKSVAGGNAIMGFNLQGANTKLAIYYKDDNNDAPIDKWDTAFAYFKFKPYTTYSLAGSAAHNYIGRDYSGTPLLAAQGGTTPDPFVYIQNSPGSFATLKIPALPGLNNRVVHRAELIAEQVYDASDTLFTPPTYMYLDAYDPTLSKYLMVPYDLVFDGTGNLNLGNFGVSPVNALDGSGKVIRTWHFNISRYVQHVVNDTEPVYDFRLFSPLFTYDQYRPTTASTATTQLVNINPTIAKGRVRLAGNTGPLDPNPHRMRLRIVYSKL